MLNEPIELFRETLCLFLTCLMIKVYYHLKADYPVADEGFIQVNDPF